MITTLHEETTYWSFEGGLIRCRIELSMGLFWGTHQFEPVSRATS